MRGDDDTTHDLSDDYDNDEEEEEEEVDDLDGEQHIIQVGKESRNF